MEPHHYTTAPPLEPEISVDTKGRKEVNQNVNRRIVRRVFEELRRRKDKWSKGQ